MKKDWKDARIAELTAKLNAEKAKRLEVPKAPDESDADFEARHKEGLTEQVLYCKACELLYHGGPACPQCGHLPAKPPRSIFAPPPMETNGELLTEAERGGSKDVYAREEQIKHWLRCLGVTGRKNGSFGMAAQIYKQKYGEFPGNDFPCIPGYSSASWKRKVADVHPGFAGRKARA